MKIETRDIQIAVSLAYKELRRLGDVLQVPMRDEEVELVRDEALKIIKATIKTTAAFNKAMKK